MTSKEPKESSHFEWTAEQRKCYIDGNYASISPEDASLDKNLIDQLVAYDKKRPVIGQLRSAIEIGTGGVLRGPAFIAPLVHESGSLYITDVSDNNVAATNIDMRKIQSGELGIWKPHQEHMARCHSAWSHAFGRAALLGAYLKLDVNDLQQDMADGIGLNYVIESRETDVETWQRHIRLISNAAIRLIHLRQTDESSGYMVGDECIPALSRTREQTETELERNGFEIIASYTAQKSGLTRQEGDDHDFSGFSGIIAVRP